MLACCQCRQNLKSTKSASQSLQSSEPYSIHLQVCRQHINEASAWWLELVHAMLLSSRCDAVGLLPSAGKLPRGVCWIRWILDSCAPVDREHQFVGRTSIVHAPCRETLHRRIKLDDSSQPAVIAGAICWWVSRSAIESAVATRTRGDCRTLVRLTFYMPKSRSILGV